MYKNIIAIFIFFLVTNIVFAQNETSSVEFVGIVKSLANVYKDPDTSSKIIKRLGTGNKVIVISDVDEDWYKIKINNVTEGFLRKKDILFENTLSKEAVRTPYELKKADLDIRATVERFNINFSESPYFHQIGIVPQIEYIKTYNTNSTLNIEIVYGVKSKFENDNVTEMKNPFASEVLSFMEVIFFKSFIVNSEKYRINIYKYIGEKPQFYTFLEYEFDENNFTLIKNRKGKIFDYVKSTIPLNEIFKYYP